MQPLVSIIVPVYKVEEYLVRCLESLGNQSLNNIEILLIDDASPDSCGEICDTYVAADSRFKVIHNQENRGLSAARNLGIYLSTSEYIMFVDSDDWVSPDFALEAYRCVIERQADLVIFGYYLGYIKKNTFKIKYKLTSQMKEGYVTRVEAINHMVLKNGGLTAVWNKLYHKSLFKNISFPEGYIAEDIGTSYKLIWQASRIYCTEKALYYYHSCRPGSITQLRSTKALNDVLEMRMQQYRDLAAWGYSPITLNHLINNVALSYFIRKNNNFTSQYDNFLRQVLCQNDNEQSYFTWKRKIMFLLYKYCPALFEVICYIMGKKIKDD